MYFVYTQYWDCSLEEFETKQDLEKYLNSINIKEVREDSIKIEGGATLYIIKGKRLTPKSEEVVEKVSVEQ